MNNLLKKTEKSTNQYSFYTIEKSQSEKPMVKYRIFFI